MWTSSGVQTGEAWVQVSGFYFRVSDSGFRVSGFRFEVTGFKFQFIDLGSRVFGFLDFWVFGFLGFSDPTQS